MMSSTYAHHPSLDERGPVYRAKSALTFRGVDDASASISQKPIRGSLVCASRALGTWETARLSGEPTVTRPAAGGASLPFHIQIARPSRG